MQWVHKAVQYYKDINPATLTGAIDVIVVERPTETGDVELACSPFHVRFGKLSVLRPIDKKVTITVNGKEIPFHMKVGETGEAFFVFETDAEVPEDLQTSPLTGPVPEGQEEPEFLDLDAASATQRGKEDEPAEDTSYSSESSPGSSRYVSLNPTQANSPIDTIRQLPSLFGSSEQGLSSIPDDEPQSSSSGTTSSAEEADEQDLAASTPPTSADSGRTSRAKAAQFVPAALVLGTEKVAHLGKAALTGLGSTKGNRKLEDVVHNSDSHEHDEESEGLGREDGASGVGDLDRSMNDSMAGLELSDPEPRSSSDYGDEVRKAARARDSDVSRILGGADGFGTAQSIDGSPSKQPFSLHKTQTGEHDGLSDALRDADKMSKVAPPADVGAAPEKAGDLMLDMSGYKLEEDEGEKADEAAAGTGRTSLEINAPLDDRAEEEMVAFTQGLLQSTDPKTLRGFFDPSDSEAESSRAASPIPMSLDDKEDPSLPAARPRPMSINSLQSLAPETEVEPSPTDGVFQTSPNQFTLRVGERVHVFELSLCGSDDFGHSPVQDERSFTEHQVSFSQFMEHEDITDHANLVVKYGGRYLTWENASPVLASLAVYRKSLVDHPEHHRRSETKATGRGWGLWWGRKPESTVSLPAQGTTPPVSPPISRPTTPLSLPIAVPSDSVNGVQAAEESVIADSDKKHYAKTLRLTSDQLKELGLKKGMNDISFSVRSSYSGFATCTSRVFLWESDFSVVISDIDGTITKSDALGHVFTMIGRDWTHLGVAKLYTDIARNGYKMMYLTSRAIGQADTTREYLKGIKQNGFQLPDGPVIMSPDRLMVSFHREVVLRKPEVFKMACLRDIQRLFHERSPFYAGFGNRITDALSYRSVGIPSSKIFTIDTNGEVKMELLELAGYKSSYIHMHDLVDQMFPPMNKTAEPEFTDFNFWRPPVIQFELPELSPPSPALSARSDSSRLAFPRLGSIASSLSRRSSRQTLVDPPPTRGTRATTPSSPLLQATVMEEPNYDEELDEDRSESESMPGSLPNDIEFERLRRKGLSPAQVYKESVVAGEDDAEEGEPDEEEYDEEDPGDEELDDFGDQLDFSSVPYL